MKVINEMKTKKDKIKKIIFVDILDQTIVVKTLGVGMTNRFYPKNTNSQMNRKNKHTNYKSNEIKFTQNSHTQPPRSSHVARGKRIESFKTGTDNW